jgi:NADH dehydrogenase
MHVLVTGGTGVVGKAAVDRLVAHGHRVRLLSRDATADAKQWAEAVKPWPGSIGDDGAVRGAAAGCDAVLHVAGIEVESPPEATFETINVEGTRRMVAEAEREGVGRFVYVSSLGAEHGSSPYHRSKLAAEHIVRGFRGAWLICRPGNVFGPGDQVISLLLRMVRTLPVVPVIGGGDQSFQPVWAEDLGEALARAVERADISGEVLELAGAERTTMDDLLDRIERLTDRSPPRLPVPEWLALRGVRAAEFFGVALPINDDQITMLLEGNTIAEGRPNALTGVLGVAATPLERALTQLADAMPEQLPDEGAGALEQHRYWVDIEGSRLDADELFALVRDDFGALAPAGLLEVGAEPGTPRRLEEGATMTLRVPLRGTVQVRVEEIRGHAITCATLEGHFLAGVIRFLVEELEPGLRFEVRSYFRAGGPLDLVGIRTIGRPAQDATWGAFVEEVARRSGGHVPAGVHSESRTLEGADAERVEQWAEEMVMRRRREESPKKGEA